MTERARPRIRKRDAHICPRSTAALTGGTFIPNAQRQARLPGTRPLLRLHSLSGRYPLLPVLGSIWSEPVSNMGRANDNRCIGWKCAVHAARQNKHTIDVTCDECGVDLGIENFAAAL